MSIKVYQIIIGELPEPLTPCTESVKAFASMKGYEYVQITKIPEQYKDMPDIRVVSNYMRVDLLCNDSDAIYFDWDVMLFDKFDLTLGDSPLFNRMGDNIMYSGDMEFWKKIRLWMEDIDKHKYELGIIFHALRSGVVEINKTMAISDANFKHYNYSNSKGF